MTDKIDPVQAAIARAAAGKPNSAKPAAAPKAAAAQPTPAPEPRAVPVSSPEPAEKPADAVQSEVLTDTVKLQPPAMDSSEELAADHDILSAHVPDQTTTALDFPSDPEPVEVNDGEPANADGDYGHGLPPPRNLPHFSF